MEKFHCYICLTDVECVFAKQVCTQQKHQVCSQCFPAVNKDKCPMCRQPNPNYVPLIQSDDSDEDDNLLLVHHNFLVNFQQLAIAQNLQIIFQGHNAGDANGWQ